MGSCELLSFASPFDCLVFDLDDTLYSSKTGIGRALKRNVEDFLVEKCGFSEAEAPRVNRELFGTYGSSLAGLRALGYYINPDEYHSFVHGRLPYDLIEPDTQLRNILLSIKQRKMIFTNSDKVHAMKVLGRLGIKDCFEKIISFETINPNLFNNNNKNNNNKYARPDEFPVVLKPSMEAMKVGFDAAEVHPHRTLFFDDNVKNVAAAKLLGLRTVLVGKSMKSREADYAVEKITDMGKVISEIWLCEEAGEEEGDGVTTSGVDTSILAITSVGA